MAAVVFRAIILYAVIVFCVRLMGKKQLGELQPSELVVTIMLSNIATLPIEDIGMPILMGLVPIFTIVCLDVFLSYLSLSSRSFRRILCGTPKIIISNGVLDQRLMKQLRFTVDDLFEAMRTQQVFDICDVQLAVVETTGQISVYVKKSRQPVTNGDISKLQPETDPPLLIVDSGEVVTGALKAVNADEKWLNTVLLQEGVTLENVFIMTCDKEKNYNIVKRKE